MHSGVETQNGPWKHLSAMERSRRDRDLAQGTAKAGLAKSSIVNNFISIPKPLCVLPRKGGGGVSSDNYISAVKWYF